MPSHLSLRGLTKRFGDTLAADAIDLDVEQGTFATLLGPSGCGKTTTLRMIAGFVQPDDGQIFIAGSDVASIPAHRRPTSMVFQDYALFPHMSVAKNVGYGLRVASMPKEEARERVHETLKLTGLGGLEDRYPSQLSGGQQQRVALARSLVPAPEVVLMDEPLSNLDAKLRVRLRFDIRQLQADLGFTAVYVTHDQEEALSMSDQIAVMDAGRIVQLADPRQLYRYPANAFVADFVGLQNFFVARVRRVGKLLELDAGSDVLLAATSAMQATEPNEGEDVLVAVRPEALRFVDGTESSRQLTATVLGHQFMGSLVRYELDIGGSTRVFANRYGDEQPHPVGDKVQLAVSPSDVRVYPRQQLDEIPGLSERQPVSVS